MAPNSTINGQRGGLPLLVPLPIPDELLYVVVESMETKDVRKCALAARRFLPIASVRNFTTIRLAGLRNRCNDFAQLIHARPGITEYVRTVVLDFNGIPGGRLMMRQTAPDLGFILSTLSRVDCLQILEMRWEDVPHDQQKAIRDLGKTVKRLDLGGPPRLCRFDAIAHFADFLGAFKSLDIIHLEATRLASRGSKALPRNVVPSLMLTELRGCIAPHRAGALGTDVSVVTRSLSWILPNSLKLVKLDLSDLDELECQEIVEEQILPSLDPDMKKLALLLSCSILDQGACWLAATLQASTANLTDLSLFLPADDLFNQITQLLRSNSLAYLRHLQVAAGVDAWIPSLQNVVTLRGLCLTSKLSSLLIILNNGADRIQLVNELDDSPYSDITEQLPRLEAHFGGRADRYIHLVPDWRILREDLFDLSDRTMPTCDAPYLPGCACDCSGPLLAISQRQKAQVALEFLNCCYPDGPLRFAE